MDFNDTHEEAKFRKKCREWLEKNAIYKDDLTPQNDDFAKTVGFDPVTFDAFRDLWIEDLNAYKVYDC